MLTRKLKLTEIQPENLQGQLMVDANRLGPDLESDLYGAFFEDLNHAADGGLYAELVQNRSFEFDPIDNNTYHSLTAWSIVEFGGGIASIRTESKLPLNTRNLNYLVLEITEAGKGVGIMNHGYNAGIPIKEGENYNFSFYSRRSESFEQPVKIRLESTNGTVYGETAVTVESDRWTKYTAVLTSSATDIAGRLVLFTTGTGAVYMDMVSLFPEHTFKNRPNGMRADIAQLIADLKPGFLRFPGGCLVHDGSLDPDARDSMYRWKNTIGDVAERPSRRNNWSYNQSLGLGFYEYFQFCEDIGAKPLPILPAAYDPHHDRAEPMDQLGPWIDDALDLIEFANGDADTVWGAKRAELGHPEPFKLEYIGIGNEEVRQGYFERYPIFQSAIREKYPNIKVICSSGPQSHGRDYEIGWNYSRQFQADMVDEHYYALPSWFLSNWHRYDDFDRNGPKVFVGEYASWGNTFYNALTEAAYMTGFERNADVVKLTCYAPMLANCDYVNWQPDLIWFNNHQVFGTINYYVQQMFNLNKGDVVLHSTLSENTPKTKEAEAKKKEPIKGKVGIGTRKTSSQYSNFIVTNNETGEVMFSDEFLSTSSDWEVSIGDWSTDNGMYTQSSTDVEICSATVGDIAWNNYTITVTGKKIGGEEGLQIIFGKQDKDNFYTWNLGGWRNCLSTIRKMVNGSEATITEIDRVTAQIDKEYRLKLEVFGRRIRCYVDDQLFFDMIDPVSTIEPLYYTASKDYGTGDIILKVVNARESGMDVNVQVEGVDRIQLEGTVIELTADSLDTANSFEAPRYVVPITSDHTGFDKKFNYHFPKFSVTILKLKTRPSKE